MADKLKLYYYRSVSGRRQDQKDTIRSLGFTRLHQTVEVPDNPSMRGMIYKVRHLVRVENQDVPDDGLVREESAAN